MEVKEFNANRIIDIDGFVQSNKKKKVIPSLKGILSLLDNKT